MTEPSGVSGPSRFAGRFATASRLLGFAAVALALFLLRGMSSVAEPDDLHLPIWERDVDAEGSRNNWRGHGVTDAMAFSSDGRVLVRLGGAAGSIVALNAQSGRVFAMHQPNDSDWMRFDGYGIGSSVHPFGKSGFLLWDGKSKQLEALSFGGTLSQSGMSVSRILNRAREITRQVMGSAISPSGDQLAVAVRGAVHLLPLRDPDHSIVLADELIDTLAYSSDGTRLVTARFEKGGHVFRVWDVAAGRLVGSIVLPPHTGYEGGVEFVSGVPNSDRFVVGGSQCGVALIDARDVRLVRDLTALSRAVTAAAVSPDGSLVSLGHRGGEVRFIDLRSIEADGASPSEPTEVRVATGAPGPVEALAWSPDGRVLAVALSDGALNMMRVAEGAAVLDTEQVGLPVRLTAMDADEKVIVVAGRGPNVWVRLGGRERVIRLPNAGSVHVAATACSGKGGSVALGTRDGRVFFGRLDGELDELPSLGEPVSAISVSEDGQRMWALGSRGRVLAWPSSAHPPVTLSAAGRTLSCSSVGEHGLVVVCVDERDRTKLYRYRRTGGVNGRWVEASIICEYPIHCCCVSPDGKLVAAGDDEYGIVLWEPDARATVRRLVGHERRVNSVAFFRDGSALVSGGDDFTIRLWDVKSGAVITKLIGNWTAVMAVAVERSGGRIVAGGDGGEVCVWRKRP